MVLSRVRILLLFKRLLDGICDSSDARVSRAVGAGKRRRQDKSRTSRHGRRGQNSLSVNTAARGARSDREVRHRPIARIGWLICTSLPSLRITESTSA